MAGEDVLKIQEVAKLPLLVSLNFLTYMSDLTKQRQKELKNLTK